MKVTTRTRRSARISRLVERKLTTWRRLLFDVHLPLRTEERTLFGRASLQVAQPVPLPSVESPLATPPQPAASSPDHPILLPDVRRVLDGLLGRRNSIWAHAVVVARHLHELEEALDELDASCCKLKHQSSRPSAELLGRIRERCDAFCDLVRDFQKPHSGPYTWPPC